MLWFILSTIASKKLVTGTKGFQLYGFGFSCINLKLLELAKSLFKSDSGSFNSIHLSVIGDISRSIFLFGSSGEFEPFVFSPSFDNNFTFLLLQLGFNY